MTNKCKTMLIAAALAWMGASAPAADAGEALSTSGDIGVVSQYVWRGVTQTKGKPAVQGDLGLSSETGVSASVWFSNAYPAGAPQYAGRDVVEFDWTLDYSLELDAFSLSAGAIWYTYLYDSASNFPEFYLGASLDAPLSPSVTVYYTFADSKSKAYLAGDLWVDLGVSASAAGWDLGGTLSFVSWKKSTANRANKNKWKSGLSVLALSASRGVKLGGTDATVSLSYSQPLAKKAPDGNRYIYGAAAKPEFVAGLNLSY